jgi:DSF synthase
MDMNIPQAVLNVPSAELPLVPLIPQSSEPHAPGEYFFSPQLSAFFERELHAMWLRWNPSPRPNFNPELLRDLDRYCRFLTQTEGRIECGDETAPIEYAILASGAKGVFNLGGDLNLFMQLIERRDRESLLRYGKACIDVLYQNYIGHGLPITTISLVQGECLGGGFEAALSSDVLIAERQARFGFPEILFNLFPGMGAYSFLERRVGRRATEELISGGKIYTADDMLALGVVDTVVDAGQGEAEVAALIKSRSRNRNGLTGVFTARRCALRLTGRDLKLMQRLVARQNEMNGARSLH